MAIIKITIEAPRASGKSTILKMLRDLLTFLGWEYESHTATKLSEELTMTKEKDRWVVPVK